MNKISVSSFLYQNKDKLKEIILSLPKFRKASYSSFSFDKQELYKIISNQNEKVFSHFVKTYFYYKISRNLNFAYNNYSYFDPEASYYKSLIYFYRKYPAQEIKEAFQFSKYICNSKATNTELNDKDIEILTSFLNNIFSFYKDFDEIETNILGDELFFQDLPTNYKDFEINNDNSRTQGHIAYPININLNINNIHQTVDFQKIRSFVIFCFRDLKYLNYEKIKILISFIIAYKNNILNLKFSNFLILYYPIENIYFYCDIDEIDWNVFRNIANLLNIEWDK